MKLPKPLTNEHFTRLKTGDHLVFKQVYDDYFGLVHFVVKQCGIGGEDALDIVHDTFLTLYKKAGTIQQAQAIKSWLITTAKNLTVDMLRKQKLANDYTRQEQGEHHNTPGNFDHSTSMNRADDGLLAASELYELELYLLGQLIDETQQETLDDTFVLFYREGLTAKEIAERKGEPVSTVTNRLSRLRSRYREKFIAQLTNLRESSL